MRALIFLLLCGPAISFAAAPLKLASPGLSLLNLDEKMAVFYTDHMGTSLKQPGTVELVTPREISSLLGMERQKQLLGCADNASSCVAELANALGADGVVLGDVARIGSRYQVNLKIISASDGKTLALFSEGATSEEALLDVLTRGGLSLRAQTLKAMGRSTEAPTAAVAPEVKQPAVSRPMLAFLPMGLGVGMIAGGVGALVVSENASAELVKGTPVSGEATASTGRTANALGLAGVIVGSAALAGGLAWYLLGGTEAPAVSVGVTPSGATMVISGSF